ncbi:MULTISPECIES: N-acetylmuramoyl-L-alanine amidase [Sphingobacterium]|uniref:N-acetylmuramoyl-L-alanine amidase n=1 Tax=Sphingobacterium TaxID=28453 RepID=UPI00211F35AC|nr:MULTISPECIES: N-acetylmuramoyl-L-alanine amidase [Sphingobacterium]MCT1530625.1 N-acetylmuramoyl-L-alanine amidase [Sphingobacterium daejeonense]
MRKISERLIVAVCGVLFLVGCSTAKKSKVLQSNTSVITPSVIVENSAPKLDTLNKTPAVVEQAKVAPPLAGANQTPEQIAWNMFLQGTSKQYDYASAMHYDVRKPSFVMIHHTSQANLAQTIRTFQLPHTKVSSHYVIGRDGRVVQMLNDYLRGWHAGRGKWGSITDMNSVSIGIELDNNGKEPFPDAQINSLLVLLDTLKTKYSIPQKNFIGHADFAPGRKDDPNVFFPWQLLAERGFGIWYNPNYLVAPPMNFNPIDALKLMGYDMTNQEAAIKSFKRKYIKSDLTGILTEKDKAVLYDLYRKYY